jgi:hypothetical protein
MIFKLTWKFAVKTIYKSSAFFNESPFKGVVPGAGHCGL